MDKKIIAVRLKKLDRVVSRLKQKRDLNHDNYIQNQDHQDVTERNFQLAIQTCMDIANYIIAETGMNVPDDEANIFKVLSENNVIPEALGKRIKGMVNFRNILVHDYLEIDPDQVYDLLQNDLPDFDEFARAILTYIESRE
ncbi:hypothetical protein A2Y85_07490 [candidate division WOR-3 bacterium RBG_13_43_14]|uniref:DUF86 domain-containing protein n=1 Tax=candidate division WOR-3 bacterium RBG_13_43_14 TaxID=1802590 RepID=A0A1F4UBT8_UNCW3|nr:MAG: hypothetical protein A2Y85_07490 [candidate division WOR-3 bacterium RBG_13_43_14]